MDEPHRLIVPVALGHIAKGIVPGLFNRLIGHFDFYLAVGLLEGVRPVRLHRHLHGLAIFVGHGDFVHLIAIIRPGLHGHIVARFGVRGRNHRCYAALAGPLHRGRISGRGIVAAPTAAGRGGPCNRIERDGRLGLGIVGIRSLDRFDLNFAGASRGDFPVCIHRCGAADDLPGDGPGARAAGNRQGKTVSVIDGSRCAGDGEGGLRPLGYG